MPKCHVTKILIEDNSKIGSGGGRGGVGEKILWESPKEVDKKANLKDTLKQSLIRYINSTYICE